MLPTSVASRVRLDLPLATRLVVGRFRRRSVRIRSPAPRFRCFLTCTRDHCGCAHRRPGSGGPSPSTVTRPRSAGCCGR